MVKSPVSHAQLDSSTRKKKAEKIISILSKHISLAPLRVLDIGTGSGYIAHELSKVSAHVYSADIYDERKIKKGYTFTKVTGAQLPYKDSTFDLIITNHVIEHIPDQKKHLSEIFRVLKPGGIVYLSTPNKYWITDPHHKLPFISWMPRALAQTYLSLFKKNEWDIYPLSYLHLKSLTRKFTFTNLTPLIAKNPRRYHIDVYPFLQPVLAITPYFILRTLTLIYPTFIVMLKKPITS